MKKLILLLVLMAFLAIGTNAQVDQLPPNPEAGKCYVKCITPDVYETKEVRVMTNPAYKKLKVVPAQYKTVEEKVLVKPASKKFIYHPAVFETYYDEYQSVAPFNKLAVIPASFKGASKTVEIEPATARWEYGDFYADCKSDDPRDCRVLCWKEYPAISETVDIKVIDKNAGTSKLATGSKTAKIKKERIAKKAYVEEIDIPAVYKTISKKVLAKDETITEETVAAVYKTVKTEVLKQKGGLSVWEEVACELTESNLLPIFYASGSAALNGAAKKVINEKLYDMMMKKPNIKVKIGSHTDSRGNSASNQLLSERRAQSVVNYLIGRGINASRLVAVGYGESRLTNRCADGVACTEKEHQQNRRTDFRVINY